MKTVKNEWDVEVDFDAAVNLMDEEIREKLNDKMAPCTDQEFFDAYAKAHEEKFCEVWELAKKNPCY